MMEDSMLEFRLEEVLVLVDMFGGNQKAVVTVQRLDERGHSGPGIYAFRSDYPLEGSLCITKPKD